MLASNWSIMTILTSDWLIATEATKVTEVMEVMEVMENTASMDTAEATDMAGEIIVINILINLMPYLINNDGDFAVSIREAFI